VVLVSGTCGYWRIGAVCGRRRYTPGTGGTGREDDGDVEARGSDGAGEGMGVVWVGAATSGPQFLRVICLRSRLDVPDEWGDMDRACHLMELAALVRSYKEVCDLAACLLYFGLAAVIYFDILCEIAISLPC